jgi:ubiquitin-protein ligase
MAALELKEQCKIWRRALGSGLCISHDLTARPLRLADGTSNLFEWHASVPGSWQLLQPDALDHLHRSGNALAPPAAWEMWQGLPFAVSLTFPQDYPAVAPSCCFIGATTVLHGQPQHRAAIPWHPNVGPDGVVRCRCLTDAWNPARMAFEGSHVAWILLRLQRLLAQPEIPPVWSTRTHHQHDVAQRRSAIEALRLGYVLAARTGQRSSAFIDIWRVAIMPLLLGRGGNILNPAAADAYAGNPAYYRQQNQQ